MAKNPYPSNPWAGAFNTPLIGNTLNNIGHVSQIIATPCATTPKVWVQALWGALPRAIFTFIKPFMYAWQFHARTGRDHRGKKGILNFIGEFEPINPVEKGSLTWAVFEVTEAILKLEWYLFVADRTADFLVNWTSLAYEYSGCKFPDETWIQGTMSGGTLVTGGGVGTLGPFKITSSFGPPSEGGLIVVPAGSSGVVMFSASASPRSGGVIPKGTSIQFWLAQLPNGPDGAKTSPNADLNGNFGGADVGLLEGSLGSNVSYCVRFDGPPGFWTLTNATLEYYGHHTGTKGLEFDP